MRRILGNGGRDLGRILGREDAAHWLSGVNDLEQCQGTVSMKVCLLPGT